MLILDVVKRSGRNLRQAKARTILTSLAIGVGAFTLLLTLAASNGAQKYVNQIITDNFDPAELIVTADKSVFGRNDTTTPKEYDASFGRGVGNAVTQIKRLSKDDIDKIKSTKNVEGVREGVILDIQYITRPGQKKYVGSVAAFSPAQNPELKAGTIPKTLTGKQLLLPEGYLTPLGFSSPEDAVGKSVILAVRKTVSADDIQKALTSNKVDINNLSSLQNLTQEGTKEETFTVAAVTKKPVTSQPGTELELYIGVDDAKALDDLTNAGTKDFQKYTYAYVRVKNGAQDKTAIKNMQKTLEGMGYFAQSVEDTQKFLTQIVTVLKGIVAAFGLIAVIASVFGVVNTMYISVIQRTREIGLMKALGMRKKDLGRLFRIEAAWIGFLGGLTGSILAFAVGTALNPWIAKKLELGNQHLLVFKFSDAAALIVMLMIVAIFAGLLPARKAAKLDPIVALRTE
jgi:putative ABC transport system permease protein